MTGEAELIALLQSLDLKTILATLTAEKAIKLGAASWSKINQIIKDKWNEGKYAFVPDKEEAIKLKQNFDKPDYKKVAELMPGYRDLDLISTGLLIREYQEMGTSQAKQRISEIKQKICLRPNYKHLMSIVRLPTTEFFTPVIGYLYSLRDKGYTVNQIEDEFTQIISGWEQTVLFVDHNKHTESQVIEAVNLNMKRGAAVFFLLGMNKQAEKIINALAKLEEKNTFQSFGYAPTIKQIPVANDKKIEVTIEKIKE